LGDIAKDYERIIRAEKYPVFVHVRRTDYLKEPHASFHGNLSLDYYEEGMRSIKKAFPDATFFIFSDDPIWCKQNFPDDVAICGTKDYEDLYLQSLCRSAIIANSSFSFWGAWLGPYQKGGVVIAPKNWFKSTAVDSSDIVPDRWVRI